MKILEKVQEIFDKYQLEPIDIPKGYSNVYKYLSDFPTDDVKFKSEKNDTYLFNKYYKYIPECWYGFAIGNPTNPKWNEIIDEILQLCIDEDIKFEIHQIKFKFGGISFGVKTEIIEDIFEVEILIANKLYDKALIY